MRPTLYLHGFLSHPNSAKPKLLREAHEKIGKPFIAPELYMSPEEVAAFLSKLIKEDLEGGPVDVIGSFFPRRLLCRVGKRASSGGKSCIAQSCFGQLGKGRFPAGLAQGERP